MTYNYLELLVVPESSFATPWIGGDAKWSVHRVNWLLDPASWGTNNRSDIRAEIDAALFHVYGVCRDDVDYIMDTFRIVKEKDESDFSEYRTKRMILEVFDAMQHAIDSGTEYRSEVEQYLTEGVSR